MRTNKKFWSRLLCIVLLSQLLTSFIGGPQMKVLAQGETLLIHFQPEGIAAPEGSIPDHGEVFGQRNGYEFGWNRDHTLYTLARRASPDTDNNVTSNVSDNTYGEIQDREVVIGNTYGGSALDTMTRIQPGGEWELKVNNGIYEVSVTVGDSVYASNNAISVEDDVLWAGLTLEAGSHETLKKSVTVADGRLTLSQPDVPGTETALNRVEITLVNMFTPAISPPQISLPAEQNVIAGDKVLMSGSMVNVHNAPPYTRIDGLRPEISRYINVQTAAIEESISQYMQSAVQISGDEAAIQRAAAASAQIPAIIKAGHLNLESSVTFGSQDHPVVLIIDGINTNRNLTITVYGSLILRGGLNANAPLAMQIYQTEAGMTDGNLWVQGSFQLNNNLNFHVDRELYAGSLTYNGGTLQIDAARVLVQGNMNINTNVTMNVAEEMSVGEIVSNNQFAHLNILKGDLFVRDNVSVNNNLKITTGGLFAVGGDLVTNQRPEIHTGSGSEGHTLLKYQLSGLKAEYYSGSNFSGQRAMKLDEDVSLSGKPVLPEPGIADKPFTVRWTGQIQSKFTEEYTFYLNTNGGSRLWVDNQPLIDGWTAQHNSGAGLIELVAGESYEITVEYRNDLGNPQASLLWESKSQPKEIVPSLCLRPFDTPRPAAGAAANEISLQWPVVFNADGYEVEIDGVISVLGTGTSYTAAGLLTGTEHTYRVRANSGDLKGGWSFLTLYWTLPDVPQGIELASTSTSITLTWEPVTGATSYEVEANNSIQDIGNVTSYGEYNLTPNMQRSFRVRAKNSSGTGAWSEVYAKSTIVGTPSGLSGVADEDSVALQWDTVSGAAAYDLEADGNLIGPIAESSYSHSGLGPNSSHEYRVRARNEEGISGWSGMITVHTLPSVPGHLTAAVQGESILVTWDEVAGAAGYDIEVDGEVIDNGAGTAYSHSGLALNSEHTYRVRARNAFALGSWTELIVYTTAAGIPNNVQSKSTSSEITVSWDVVPGAKGYDIEVDGKVIQGGLDNSYVHSGLKPFSTHTYRVRARNAGGNGEWSRLITAQTIFGKPGNLQATAGNSSIAVTWSGVDGATGYDILVDGEVYDNGISTKYEHTNLEPYTWHVYRVRAKVGNIAGEWSEALTRSTVLGIPGNIQVKVQSDQITLTWDPVGGAAGYEVEADGKLVDNKGKVSFTHTGLLPYTKHSYRIRAKNTQVTGEWSEWTTTITSMTAPAVPANLRGAATINSVTLTWDGVAGAADYELEVDGQVMKGITATSYLHTGLLPNTMHSYRVRARNAELTSDWSDQLKKTTIPALTIQPEKDTMFNFLVMVPPKAGMTERKVVVTYSAKDLEVIDLRAETPELDTVTGRIEGTGIIITAYEPGRIEFTLQSSGKTAMNTIKFAALSNEFTKVTYIIE